ncbi:MAG: HAMP domain-containing sensor histidine kinase [Bryobacteraceae bacterium]
MSNTQTDLTIECLVHDLNNVFQTLLEAADLLTTDPQWAGLAGTIFRSVDRGKSITQSLTASEPDQVDLTAAIDKSVQFAEDFVATALNGRVVFARDLAPGLKVKGASSVWERVFVNLFLNAVQEMPAGGRVHVHSRAVGDRAEIVVFDDGPGISATILNDIFKPRFSTSLSRSGLGLHIVATIVAQHHGSVLAGNRTDSTGAIFTISLPLEGVAAETPLAQSARA